MRASPDVFWQPSIEPWQGMAVAICIVLTFLGPGTAPAVKRRGRRTDDEARGN